MPYAIVISLLIGFAGGYALCLNRFKAKAAAVAELKKSAAEIMQKF